MKVCITGLRGIPRVMGGVETHCEQLYPRLKALAPVVEFEVLGRRAYVPDAPYVFEGVQVTPLGGLPSKYLEAISHTFASVLHARFVARARLLHIHAIGPGVLAPLAKLLGLRVVVTHHGQDFKRRKWNRFAQAVLRAGEWCSIAAADRVIVVGKSLAEDLKAQYPGRASRIQHIPNGMQALPPTADGAALMNRLGLEAGGYLLGVGRLVPEKGFHDLLDAYEGLETPLKLVIAGEAQHEDRYSRELTARAGPRVIFTGALQQADLAALYRGAALFVHPSSHEGLPIAVLEAIAYGARVLISDIDPNRDIGLPEAVYFPVGDVEALRAKLAQPFSDYAVDADGVARRFDWDQVAVQSAEVYRACGVG